jgi:hypothetical protein
MRLLALDRSELQALAFLCTLLALLPPQLGRLARRRAAFVKECLAPAAALARVCARHTVG